ncbi:MAG: DUF4215 domain-containing protein, partial [Bdellovibrionales bacterium]|nr:DUF4215 domain-containing protein [Bdellovibrionales bacterium]
QCDDGNDVDGDGCNAQCQTEYCGDGVVQTSEQCDDGNNTSGDGCDATCHNEYCGDGITQAGLGEQCDDGNDVSGDGCNAQCQTEYCGDGITQTGLGEQCDDGNNVDGDGCNATCQAEYCGDGITQAGLGEQCDDGNYVDGDGCSMYCMQEYCGDGITQPGLGEQCDDGNDIDGDGCSATCQEEYCGDGIVQGFEQCDDGNDVNGDGCNNDCGLEFCGDGILQAALGEQCDDGNNTNGDGCESDCSNPPVDCLGTPYGTAELDVCGVCDGDGTSCLDCGQFDNTEQLMSLDGGADAQKNLVIRSIRTLKRKAGASSVRKFVKARRLEALALYEKNWVLTWTIPTVVETCSNTVLCVQTDYSTVTAEYNDNSARLREIVEEVVSKLRKKTGRKKAGKSLLEEASVEYEANLALSSSVATISSNCDL